MTQELLKEIAQLNELDKKRSEVIGLSGETGSEYLEAQAPRMLDIINQQQAALDAKSECLEKALDVYSAYEDNMSDFEPEDKQYIWFTFESIKKALGQEYDKTLDFVENPEKYLEAILNKFTTTT